MLNSCLLGSSQLDATRWTGINVYNLGQNSRAVE
jgi:hypothetical protein